jgi:hypothetical protein
LIGPIFEYSFKRVDKKKCTSFHVRGSSAKEKVNLNKKLMIFMMHEDTLYGWIEEEKDLKEIAKNASNLYYLSDDAFFFMTTEPIDEGKKI